MEKIRISLLAVICGSVFFALGKTVLYPSVSSSRIANSTVTPLVFPTAVPLPEWQASSSRPLQVPSDRSLADPTGNKPRLLSARQYRYIQSNLPLDIEMQYVVNSSGKFTTSFIKNYSSIQPSLKQLSLVSRYREGIGFYNLFAYQERAYLSACINSRGGSTVSRPQFMQNRLIYDMRLDRLIPWLQGQQPLHDRRCLWAYLSIPFQNSSPQNAYRILETAWFPWYQWWYPRFLKS